MSSVTWSTVGVAGAGTMGRGIAQAVALSGYDVTLYDISQEALAQAREQIHQQIDKGVALQKVAAERAQQVKERLRLTSDLEDVASCDLVIEAAPESKAIKQELFSKLDQLAPQETVFASNTSSLSINVLAGMTQRPAQFCGMHFFNPAHIMKLVELIGADDTEEQLLQEAAEFVRSLGKIPVHCKDTPAFIVNRVARPYYGEALRMLGEGVADVETIDKLMRSAGFRMGPFELIDLVGCDVNFAVTQSVYEAYFQDPKYRPHPIQQRMVESGRLGRKSGRGFYKYDR